MREVTQLRRNARYESFDFKNGFYTKNSTKTELFRVVRPGVRVHALITLLMAGVAKKRSILRFAVSAEISLCARIERGCRTNVVLKGAVLHEDHNGTIHA